MTQVHSVTVPHNRFPQLSERPSLTFRLVSIFLLIEVVPSSLFKPPVVGSQKHDKREEVKDLLESATFHSLVAEWSIGDQSAFSLVIVVANQTTKIGRTTARAL